MSTPSTSNEAPYYMETYNYYLEKSSYSDMVQEFIDEDIFPKIKDVLKKEKILVLSVGPGPGIPDAVLLKSLNRFASSQQRRIDILYTVVEPHEGFMGILQQDLTALCYTLTNLNMHLNFEKCKVQEYLHDYMNKFNLIFMLHCLYYMDVPTVLPLCYNQLSERGCLVSQIGGERLLDNGISVFIKNLGLKSKVQLRKGYITDILTKNAWKFCTSSKSYYLDLTEVLHESTVKGSKLLEYYIRVADLKTKISQEEWRSLLHCIENCLRKKNDTKVIASLTDELILISKD